MAEPTKMEIEDAKRFAALNKRKKRDGRHRFRDEYLKAKFYSIVNRNRFNSVKCLTFFIGHQRSGHSLIGALLNAHPNALISHELDFLRFFMDGFPPHYIYTLLYKRDIWFEKGGRKWTGYDYTVEGQLPASKKTILTIGDKRGGGSLSKLARRPDLLEIVRQSTGLPVRVIYHVRDPFDNIASIASRHKDSLESAAAGYFRQLEQFRACRSQFAPEELLVVHHQDLVDQPRETLGRAADFLMLPRNEAFLTNAAAIVHPAPRKTGTWVDWPEALTDRVRAEIETFDFLQRYRS